MLKIGKYFLFTLLLTSCSPPIDHVAHDYSYLSIAEVNAKLSITDLMQGYTDRAQSEIDLALELAPEDPLVLDAAGYYYEKTGELDLANRYYFGALLNNPQSASATEIYGAFLCRNAVYKEGLRAYRKAIRMSNNAQEKETIEANDLLCKKIMKEARHDLSYPKQEKEQEANHGRRNNRTQ